MEMEPDVERRKIEETVLEILKNADLETTSEYDVRTTVAERLAIDLCDLDNKLLVRRVVESFLLSTSTQSSLEQNKVQEQTKEVVVQERQQENRFDLEEGSNANIINGGLIYKLSDKKTVAIQEFRGNRLVSIRDYYEKDIKQFPSARGITLTAKQWSAFRNNIPAIEEAIAKMESRIRSEDARTQIKADMSSSLAAIASEGLSPEGKQLELNVSNSVTAVTPQGDIPIERKQVEAVISSSVTAFAPQKHVPHHSMTAFSPNRLIHIETTRFDGKNYYCWMHQMEFFLKQLNIAYVITEQCPSTSMSLETSVEGIIEAKVAAQKWVDDDYVCRRNILNSLSDHLFDQYSKICSAKELWEELKSVYDEDFGTKRSQVNKYIKFQMVDGISILEQVQELHKIADSVISSGMWIDENFHVSVIVSKLPPSWKDFRMKLMQQEFLPLNMLLRQLRIEEESRNHYKKGKPSKNVHLAESKIENKRKRETKKLCYACGKEGHISKHCQHRKLDAREKSNEKENGVMHMVPEVNMVEGIVE